MGDSVNAKQSALLERIVAMSGPSVFDCMAAAMRTMTADAVAKTTLEATVCTTFVVEN